MNITCTGPFGTFEAFKLIDEYLGTPSGAPVFELIISCDVLSQACLIEGDEVEIEGKAYYIQSIRVEENEDIATIYLMT